MADKAEIEYWITKLKSNELRDLVVSINNELETRLNQECKECLGSGGINAMGYHWQGVPNLKMCEKCDGNGKIER